MSMELRRPAMLVGAVLVWLPALSAFLRGDLDAGAVTVRFAGAVAIAWAGVAVVASVISAYTVPNVAVADDGAGPSGRRSEDGLAAAPAEPTATDGAETSVLSDASDG